MSKTIVVIPNLFVNNSEKQTIPTVGQLLAVHDLHFHNFIDSLYQTVSGNKQYYSWFAWPQLPVPSYHHSYRLYPLSSQLIAFDCKSIFFPLVLLSIGLFGRNYFRLRFLYICLYSF